MQQQYENESGEENEGRPSGQREGRPPVSWARPRMNEKLLLCLQYECERQEIKLPWDAVVHRLNPGSGGAAAVQHLSKTRRVLLREGHMVPPVVGEGSQGAGEDETIRGFVRDFEAKDPKATKPVYWSNSSEVVPAGGRTTPGLVSGFRRKSLDTEVPRDESEQVPSTTRKRKRAHQKSNAIELQKVDKHKSTIGFLGNGVVTLKLASSKLAKFPTGSFGFLSANAKGKNITTNKQKSQNPTILQNVTDASYQGIEEHGTLQQWLAARMNGTEPRLNGTRYQNAAELDNMANYGEFNNSYHESRFGNLEPPSITESGVGGPNNWQGVDLAEAHQQHFNHHGSRVTDEGSSMRTVISRSGFSSGGDGFQQGLGSSSQYQDALEGMQAEYYPQYDNNPAFAVGDAGIASSGELEGQGQDLNPAQQSSGRFSQQLSSSSAMYEGDDEIGDDVDHEHHFDNLWYPGEPYNSAETYPSPQQAQATASGISDEYAQNVEQFGALGNEGHFITSQGFIYDDAYGMASASSDGYNVQPGLPSSVGSRRARENAQRYLNRYSSENAENLAPNLNNSVAEDDDYVNEGYEDRWE